MLKISKLNKYYNRDKGNELHVLKDLDFELNNNEYVSIMGTSGVGKTTLLNIIGCLDTFEYGEYIFNGKNIKNLKEKELEKIRGKEISFVFQDYLLIEEDSVLENIMVPLYFDNRNRKLNFKNEAKEALHLVGLEEDLLNKKCSQLSGGQKQRVAIARSIVTKPKLILADEPTGALDEKNTEDILNLFEKLTENDLSVIVVTHDIDVAKKTQKIYEMVDGKLKIRNN